MTAIERGLHSQRNKSKKELWDAVTDIRECVFNETQLAEQGRIINGAYERMKELDRQIELIETAKAQLAQGIE